MATTASVRQHASEVTPLAALNHVNALATSYFASQAFSTACKLGVFDELSRRSATADDLAAELGLHPDGCRRLLAALRQMRLVESEDGRYRNSPVGAYLTADSPVPLGALAMWGAPFYHMWEFLPDALRDLSPVWQQALGTSAEETFAALYENPERVREFARCMNACSIPVGQEVAERFDFTPYRCVLDVAGGPGGFAIQIGLRYPHLRGIIMDLPPVCEVAEEDIRASGLADRFRADAADLFAGPYPSGADVITLCFVLHDWSDASCRTILRNCFEALPSGGALLVGESVLNDDYSGSDFGVFLSLHMAVVCEPGARERTEGEYRSLLEETGFRRTEVIRFGAPRDLIVAHKP
jgi:hypothetical protein